MLKFLQFDYELESAFPLNDPETEFYRTFQKEFENDSDYALIGIQNNDGIFQYDFLEKIDSLTRLIKDIPDVLSVQSPTNVKQFKRVNLYNKLAQTPYLHWKDPSRYAVDSALVYNSPNLANTIFSRDRKTVLIFVKNTNKLNAKGCEALADNIDGAISQFTFDKVHRAGKCMGQTDFIRMMRGEVVIFIGAAFLMIILFLLFAYRKLWGIYIPISVVALTVLWLMGTMVVTGKKVDIVSNIIPTILLVIGISNAVHLLTHYLTDVRDGVFKLKALRSAIKEVGLATIMTTTTTAIGFLSLTTSSFRPLIQMGIYSTFGLVFAFLLTYTLMPAIIALHPPLLTDKRNRDFWKHKLTRMFYWTKSNQKGIMIVSIGLIILGAIGASQIRVNNYVLPDLKPDSSLRKDFGFFAETFSGVRPFEVVVETKDTSDKARLIELDILQEIEVVDSFIAKLYNADNVVSPASIMSQSNCIYHSGDTTYYRLPRSTEVTQTLRRNLKKNLRQTGLTNRFNRQMNKSRISAQVADFGGRVLLKKNQELYDFIDTNFPNSKVKYKVTGSAHLMDVNTSNLTKDVLGGLALAVAIIAVLFGFLLRSFKMMLICLLPNFLPLLFVAGLMGFMGIELKLSTSIIFIISFGIAVDDSIHFISRFRHELKTNNVNHAVKNTFVHTGKAILVTSLILMAGFLTLCFSDFLGTFNIGILIATTLLVALIADLTLLPVLILKYYKK